MWLGLLVAVGTSCVRGGGSVRYALYLFSNLVSSHKTVFSTPTDRSHFQLTNRLPYPRWSPVTLRAVHNFVSGLLPRPSYPGFIQSPHMLGVYLKPTNVKNRGVDVNISRELGQRLMSQCPCFFFTISEKDMAQDRRFHISL